MESSISSRSIALASSASTAALFCRLIFIPTSGEVIVDSTVEMYDSNYRTAHQYTYCEKERWTDLALGLVLLRESFIGSLESLGVGNHLIDLSGRETSDRVGDGDVGPSTGSSIESGNLEQTIRVDFESTDELSLSSGLRSDTRELSTSHRQSSRGKSETTNEPRILREVGSPCR